jgi:hypothetical protein
MAVGAMQHIKPFVIGSPSICPIFNFGMVFAMRDKPPGGGDLEEAD